MIYLDNAATARPYRPAKNWMNPSSTLYNTEARNIIEGCRRDIAGRIGTDPDTIIFNSGSTEAANTIIRCLEWDVIITTAVEHPCVYESCLMADTMLFYVGVDREGRLDTHMLIDLLECYGYRNDVLVAIMGANNETGSIFSVADIVAKYPKAYLFCDTTQLWVHEPIDGTGIDYACMSAHKFGGPKGVGFMYVDPYAPYRPLLLGGHQENNRRAGTENTEGILLMTEAFALNECTKKDNHRHAVDLRKYILSRSDYRVNGGKNVTPSIVSLTLPDCDAQRMVSALAMDGIYISAGSACSTGNNKPSRVLMAMDLTAEEAARTIRISFGPNTTKEDIDLLFERIAYYRKVFNNEG